MKIRDALKVLEKTPIKIDPDHSINLETPLEDAHNIIEQFDVHIDNLDAAINAMKAIASAGIKVEICEIIFVDDIVKKEGSKDYTPVICLYPGEIQFEYLINNDERLRDYKCKRLQCKDPDGCYIIFGNMLRDLIIKRKNYELEKLEMLQKIFQ